MHRSVTKFENGDEINFKMNEGDYSSLVSVMKEIKEFANRIPAQSISFSRDCYTSFIAQNGREEMRKLLDYSFCADITGDSIDYIGF